MVWTESSVNKSTVNGKSAPIGSSKNNLLKRPSALEQSRYKLGLVGLFSDQSKHLTRSET